MPAGNAMRPERFRGGPSGHFSGGDQHRQHRRGHGDHHLRLPSTWDLGMEYWSTGILGFCFFLYSITPVLQHINPFLGDVMAGDPVIQVDHLDMGYVG